MEITVELLKLFGFSYYQKNRFILGEIIIEVDEINELITHEKSWNIRIKIDAENSKFIKNVKKIDEVRDYIFNNFSVVSSFVIRYLCENHHPHTAVNINCNTSELLEGLEVFKTDAYIVD